MTTSDSPSKLEPQGQVASESLKKWIEGKRNSHTRLGWILYCFYIIQFLGALGPILSSLDRLTSSSATAADAWTFIMLLLIVAAYFGYCYFFYQRNLAVARRYKFPPATPKVRKLLEPLVQEFCARNVHGRFQLHPEQIDIYVNPRDMSANPSTVSPKGRTHLILPAGYLKLVSSDPGLARAIMNHELSHALHRDSKIMLHAMALSRIGWFILLPGLVSVVMQLNLLNEARVSAAHARAIQEKLDTSYDACNRSIWEVSENAACNQVRSDYGSAVRTIAISEAVETSARFSVATILIVFITILSFRYLRLWSEYLADARTVLSGNGPDLLRALEQLHGRERFHGLFRWHPPLKMRLRNIQRCINAA